MSRNKKTYYILKEKEKFIKLRAERFSFDPISDRLKISKPILIKKNL